MDVDGDNLPLNNEDVLDSVEGEIFFFRALMRARPVGIHRHFHVMAMQRAIELGTGRDVEVESIWRKLDGCFNLEALEALEGEYDDSESPSSTPQPVPTPGSDDNLAFHPFFRTEFTLPPDNFMDELIALRRMRDSPSPPSSPFHSPSEPRRARGRKRKASKADLAGLISGDSDSSALTQESGDEKGGNAQTPSDRRGASVATATDAGTEDIQDEDDAASPDTSARPKRGGRKSVTRGRGVTVSRGTRKRKKQ
ncbi:hypothetical protein SCHPADRAFT_995467 [Schizopora paradoxa]|uniref:CT20-domain-containing protein n=1 Tax=Schizopora paradoxa TaxID=27342 RepID=A0A0H2RWJ9_9AGAM|nr:hypothetical protein SCHPADRAFT_995467 [Schizopora paradoxa]